MSHAACIPCIFYFTRATVVVAVKNLLNAKSESENCYPSPSVPCWQTVQTRTHTGRRPAGTGAPHTRNPQKSKNHWRHERTTVVQQHREHTEKEREQKEKQFTLVSIKTRTTTTHRITPHSPQTTTAGRTHTHT